MILKPGDKLLIAHRRLYENDDPRYFVGEVAAYDAGIIKAVGFSFVKDFGSGDVIRKHEPRTKILSISSYAFLIYQLASDVDITNVRFYSEDGHEILADGADLKMNLAEYPRQGHL